MGVDIGLQLVRPGQVERELEPGELATLDGDGVTIEPFLERRRTSPCIFERIYFARPDSTVFDRSVYDFRMRSGERLCGREFSRSSCWFGRSPVRFIRPSICVPARRNAALWRRY